MALLYLWIAIVGLLVLMLLGKLVTKCVLAGKGLMTDWSAYNSMLLVLTFIAFLPIAVLAALIKGVK
jgi:hypothetical protein